MKILNKKGFTLIEVIIVLAIIAILTSVSMPSFGGYIDKSKAIICSNNISTMNRLFKTYKAENPACTLEDAFAGSCGELSENFANMKCPSGGTYSVSGGVIVCSAHSGGGGGEDPGEETPATYPGTDVPLDTEIWPIEIDFDMPWSTVDLVPSSIFQYDDGEYYVIVRSTSVNWDQAQSGPGGTLYSWYVTHRITGNFVSFAPGESYKTPVVRGDLCEFGDDYDVFIDGGTRGAAPDVNPSQWYRLP